MSDTELGQITEQTEYLQKPKNNGNYDHSIQDGLDPTEVVLSSKCSAALNPMKSRYDPALFVKACRTVTVAI